MLTPLFAKNDTKANLFIWTVSSVVLAAVIFLVKVKLFNKVDLGFNVHYLALFNAVVNGTVSVLLVWALVAIKNKQYVMHKNLMMAAIVLSFLFLLSYIAHHLLANETPYGGAHDAKFFIYLFILITHIVLAAVILPFILFTAYRSLTGEYEKHKKLAKYTWPLWFYVSVTGVLVFWLISPYYLPHL